MANTVQLKRSAVPGKVPTTSDLALGEIGINTFDGKVYIKRDNGTPSIVEIGAGGASVGGSDTQVLFNDGGSINGDAGLTYNKTTDALTVAGSLTAASLIPSGTTVPSNGLYLPAANSIGLSTGTSERMRIRSDGGVAIGGTGSSSVALHLQRKITGFTSSYSAYVQTTVAPDVTGVASGFFTQIGTDAGTYTTANLAHYVATQGTIGAGSAVTDKQGFVAASSLIGGTNNYGFYSEIPNGTNRFSFYSTNGSADSYFGGNQFFVAPGGSTMAYCSSSGLLVGGITSARTFDVDQTAIVPRIQAEGTTYSASAISATRNSAGAQGSSLILAKSRGTTNGSNAILLANDVMGQLVAQGTDGTNFEDAADIRFVVDGTPANNIMPARIEIRTRDAVSTVGPSERVRIDSSGNVGIGTTSISERLTVSGNVAANAFIPTSATVPANGIYLPAANTVGVATSSGLAMLLDSGRRLIKGHTASLDTANLSGSTLTPGIQQHAVDQDNASIGLTNWQNFANAAHLVLGKSRGGTVGVHAATQSGDLIGVVNFVASDGTAFGSAGHIRVAADGAASAGSTPGWMAFSTSSPGSTSPSERMRIRSDGNIGVKSAGSASVTLYNQGPITGSTTAHANYTESAIQSGVTTAAYGNRAVLRTVDAAFTLSDMVHYSAGLDSVGVGSTITNIRGFWAESSLGLINAAQVSNVFGFRGDIAAGTGRWNFYAAGTASNYFDGSIGVGTTSITEKLTVSGNVAGNAFIPVGSTVPVNGLYLPAANTVGISAGTTEKVRVDTNGLQVSGSARIANNNLAASSYTTVSLDISAQETAPTGIFFSPDGLNMYVTGTTGDDVNWYRLSTAWVVSTAIFNSVFSVSGQDTAPADIYFRSDGLKMYLLGATNSSVFSYSLRLPWQLNTATYDGISFSASAQDTTCRGLFFHPNGTSFYVLGATNDTVFRYNIVGNAWNISVSTLASSFSVATQETDPHSLAFSADGTQMYVIGNVGDDVNIYRLSTPWDITTATFVTTYSGATENNAPQGLYVSPDNSKFYTVRATAPATVFQYSSPLNTVEVTGRAEFFGDVRVDQTLAVDGGVTTNTVQAYNRVDTAYVTTAPVSGFRNALINPNFSIWQRGNSFAVTTATGYCADRWGWSRNGTGSTLTISRQSFTAGQQDVPNEPEFFLRYDQTVAGTTATSNDLFQRIEDVRTFAGQQVTLTFYAKAAAAINIGTVILTQNFGAGGTVSGAVTTNVATNVAIGTTWSKYTLTFNVPSIATRNIGTTPNTSYLQLAFRLPLNAVFTFDIAQVQMEASPAATAFEQRPIGVELALCQRYYYRIAPGATTRRFGSALTASTTTGRALTFFPVTMRVAPTALEQSGTAADYAIAHVLTVTVLSAVPVFSNATTQAAVSNLTVASGLTAGQAAEFYTNSTNAFVAWSAEL